LIVHRFALRPCVENVQQPVEPLNLLHHRAAAGTALVARHVARLGISSTSPRITVSERRASWRSSTSRASCSAAAAQLTGHHDRGQLGGQRQQHAYGEQCHDAAGLPQPAAQQRADHLAGGFCRIQRADTPPALFATDGSCTIASNSAVRSSRTMDANTDNSNNPVRAGQADANHPLYEATLVQLQRGVDPAVVAGKLIAQGTAPSEATRLLSRIHEVLQAEQAAAGRATTEHIYRYIAAHVKANRHAELDGFLAQYAFAPHEADRLVHDARRAWHELRARQRALRMATVLAVTAGLLSALLLLNHRFQQLQEAETAGRAPHLAGVAQPAITASIAAFNAEVVATRLNVRTGPGAEYPLMVELKARQPVLIIGRAAHVRRYKVRLPDAREGWIWGGSDAVKLYTSPQNIPIADHGP